MGEREDYIGEPEKHVKEDCTTLELKKLAQNLQDGPEKDSLLNELIKPLYTMRCGDLRAWFGTCRGGYQNLNEVWVIACQALE